MNRTNIEAEVGVLVRFAAMKGKLTIRSAPIPRSNGLMALENEQAWLVSIKGPHAIFVCHHSASLKEALESSISQFEKQERMQDGIEKERASRQKRARKGNRSRL